jgi:hypothetical protein
MLVTTPTLASVVFSLADIASGAKAPSLILTNNEAASGFELKPLWSAQNKFSFSQFFPTFHP